MLKIFTWFVSADTKFFQDAMKILERQHGGIEHVGSAAGEEISNARADCDVLLVVGAKQIGMNKVTRAATHIGLDAAKLLGDWIVCIPGFTLDKYRRLQRSRLTIFSHNCFGGLISHTLGLEFRTPFVNMFLSAREYLQFLRAPRVYMEEPPTFKETQWQPTLKFDYPVVTLGNIDIHMNHYRSFDEAVNIWQRRKARINWYNLFVAAYTESEDVLREFDAMPYGKKVCFVPFKSDLDSAWHINPTAGAKFWGTVNKFAQGEPFTYDPFDMLLYGKKTPTNI